MTEKILTGNALRDWDPADTKGVYWAGAARALIAGARLPGCKRSPIGNALLKAHTEAYDRLLALGVGLDCDEDSLAPERRAWYTMGAAEALTDVLDALPDSVMEHHPGGMKSLRSARRKWIAENSRIADAYARKAGLLK